MYLLEASRLLHYLRRSSCEHVQLPHLPRFLGVRFSVAMRAWLSSGASVGVAGEGPFAQSILYILGTQTASLWCAISRGASNALVLQMTAYMSYRRVAEVCLSLAEERGHAQCSRESPWKCFLLLPPTKLVFQNHLPCDRLAQLTIDIIHCHLSCCTDLLG